MDNIHSDSNSNNNNTTMAKTKRQREESPTEEDIIRCARDMMNKSRYVIKAPSTEERTFRTLFGCAPAAALSIWTMLVTTDTVPSDGTITYFLWSLLFMKVYASTEVLLKVAGNPDAKTFRLWVWRFIPAIGNLQPLLVSGRCILGEMIESCCLFLMALIFLSIGSLTYLHSALHLASCSSDRVGESL
jgi:hypothetical protein